jgi:hypothetical protein
LPTSDRRRLRRELYSDYDEAIFDATRPLVFNAIPDLGAARPDFLDRVVIIEFLDMKPEVRVDEAQFWREFEQIRPRILGALLDAVSAGLRNLPNLRFDELPRMADFALWVNACEGSLGMRPGEALTAYSVNRAEARNLALESSPLYEPVAKLALEGFSGTVAALLAQLSSIASESIRRSVRWPKAPGALGAALRRMATNLRAAGIEIQFSRPDHSGRRIVSIQTAADTSKSSSASSATSAAAPKRKLLNGPVHLPRQG